MELCLPRRPQPCYSVTTQQRIQWGHCASLFTRSIRIARCQLQSPLFALPPEIRNIIFRYLVLNGAHSQHVHQRNIAYHNEHKPKLVRIPCHPMSDVEWVKQGYQKCRIRGHVATPSGSNRSIQDIYRDPYRNGHLCCGEMLKLPSFYLDSPVAFFRTCHQANEEASWLLYASMLFSSFDDLNYAMQLIPQPSLAKFESLEVKVDRSRLENLCVRLQVVDFSCRFIADSKIQLPPIRIIVDNRGIPESSNLVWWFTSIISPPRNENTCELHVVDVTSGERKTNGTQCPSMLVRHRREPGWVRCRDVTEEFLTRLEERDSERNRKRVEEMSLELSALESRLEVISKEDELWTGRWK